jgi:hypothetical protein
MERFSLQPLLIKEISSMRLNQFKGENAENTAGYLYKKILDKGNALIYTLNQWG